MGQEVECRMRQGGRSLSGKALLETDHVLFRGDERLKVLFKDLTSVAATAGVLRLEFAGGPAELELGKAAEKWAEKILHPPSRAAKLGVKAGVAVKLVGDFDAEFVAELRASGADVGARSPDLVFYSAAKSSDLARVAKLAAGLTAKAALWIVYPKGVTAIRESDVITAGRAAGLKDTKVASFSETHTALRFSAPAK